MSYEGSREFLCLLGHHLEIDCNQDDPHECPHCHSPIAFRHSIDHTNGYDEDDPNTYPAEKVIYGHDDIWHKDHHSNRYATKRYRWSPADDNWQLILKENKQ